MQISFFVRFVLLTLASTAIAKPLRPGRSLSDKRAASLEPVFDGLNKNQGTLGKTLTDAEGIAAGTGQKTAKDAEDSLGQIGRDAEKKIPTIKRDDGDDEDPVGNPDDGEIAPI